MSGFDYINRTYGLSVKRGTRVRYTGGEFPRFGSVTSASGAHLMVKLDGAKVSLPHHPTWELEVLPD